MTKSLWSSDDCAVWQTQLAAYDAKLVGSERLPALDTFVHAELPQRLAAQGHIDLPQLLKVVEWKMKRGKFRARNLWLVGQNASAVVQAASARAIAAMPDPRTPIAALCELDGVGPATASAVLAALRPDVYPFFDEDVAAQVPGLGAVKFTLPYYLRYAEALRQKAATLQHTCGPKWNAHAVGLALWSASR
jgi:hypothetical protein